jgi:hypothetical protein
VDFNIINYGSNILHLSDTGEKWEYIDFERVSDSVMRAVSYSSLIEFGVSMKVVWVIKVCLNEACSEVCIRKKSVGYICYPKWPETRCFIIIAFQLALEYPIRKV